MRSQLSPSLRSRYDYYYSSMSPASSAVNYYENQNQSLFGDPVPPSTDFLESLDSHLYGSLRRGSTFFAEHQFVRPPQQQQQQLSHLSHHQPQSTTAFVENYLRNSNSTGSDSLGRNMPPDERTVQDESFYGGYRKRSNSSYSDDIRSNLDSFR